MNVRLFPALSPFAVVACRSVTLSWSSNFQFFSKAVSFESRSNVTEKGHGFQAPARSGAFFVTLLYAATEWETIIYALD